MEGWYRRLITELLIVFAHQKCSFLVSWLQQAYHAATVINQMRRMTLNRPLNSGQQQQQQQQQEGTGSSGNPTQNPEQSQVSCNQHTGPLGPSPPPSSNLSNWSRHASHCSPCQAWCLRISLLTPFQSLPPTTRRRYTCATNASSWADNASLCPHSLSGQCVATRKQRKHKKSWA